MTLDEATAKLARALTRAIGDHGQPNSFGCQELEWIYNGPPARYAGRIALDPCRFARLRKLTGLTGLEYRRRRFCVPADNELHCYGTAREEEQSG